MLHIKIRVVSSREEIVVLNPNERTVHLAFRPSNKDIFSLVENCPKLEVIYLPKSYMQTVSKSIEMFLEMQRIQLIEGDVWKHWDDINEYYTIPSSVIEEIKKLKTEGKSIEDIEAKVLRENRLNPRITAYIVTKETTSPIIKKKNITVIEDIGELNKDLINNDKDSNVRQAVSVLISLFSDAPEKQQAWSDLIKLAYKEDIEVTLRATSFLGSVFSQVPDKQWAWNDLIKLTSDKRSYVRLKVASILGSVFHYVPDKQQAWEDLHRLTNDLDNSVRFRAASALGSVFHYVPDKKQAWEDLHRLTNDEDKYVRLRVASALGSLFPYVSDQQQVWDDLHRLTDDRDDDVRVYSNYSFGKVYIFKASQAEKDEDYKKKLEKAIEFFEKAAKESKHFSPSQFCFPFFRSFHTIVFKEWEAKGEVDKYLAEVKNAVKGSKSKKLLLETVENLANALREVQNLENMDLKTKKNELNIYRKYCEQAAELMMNTEDATPFATKVMRRGLPLLDQKLKSLVEEIKDKAEIIRDQTKGTQFEQLGDELNQSSQSLLQVRDPVGFKKQVNIVQNTLKAICSKFPEGQKGEACELLKMMDAEPSIEDKIPFMVNILSKFSYQLDMTAHLNRIEEKLDQKLSCISYDIFKIKLNSYNVITNLDDMKKELKKLNEIEGLNESLMEKLDPFQAEKLNDLNKNILERLDEIRILIEGLPNNDDTQKITDSLNELKQSGPDVLLQRSSAVISLIGFIMQVLPQVLAHKPV